MMTRSSRVFLDTSVIFAAVLSPSGGARTLLKLGEIGLLDLTLEPNVLRECESIVRRKSPKSLPTLAALLEISHVEITERPNSESLALARSLVQYPPDAYILAEAIAARPDWFITHDKLHLLKLRHHPELEFSIGSPGDLIRSLTDRWTG